MMPDISDSEVICFQSCYYLAHSTILLLFPLIKKKNFFAFKQVTFSSGSIMNKQLLGRKACYEYDYMNEVAGGPVMGEA